MLRLKTILAATDLSDASHVVLDAAARLAAAAGADLHVLFVPTNADRRGRDNAARAHEAQVRRSLARTRSAARDASIHIVPGDPRTTIGPFAETLHADVIVLGKHAPTHDANCLIGSTAQAVIISAGVPVLVISRPISLPIWRALVAIDESETSRGALIVAMSWASALRDRAGREMTLTAVHVDTGRETQSVRATIEGEVEALRRLSGDWARVAVAAKTLEFPDPVAAIVGYANESQPDIAVLGTRALSRPTHPALGSVAAALANRLDMPVLLVPPAIWGTYSHDMELYPEAGIDDPETAVL